MANTVIAIPPKIVFGAGSISELGKEAKALGTKALFVTYPDMKRIGLLDKLLSSLTAAGVSAVVFDSVEPNPRTTSVDKGAALFRQEKCDLIIGLGGGSAMDCAKGIAATSTINGSSWDLMQRKMQIGSNVPPIIQVPTMAATGSEINGIAVLTHWEAHYKAGLTSNSLLARTAIIDPALTVSVPPRQTRAGGADIFCHVVEPYCTDGAPQPLTDDIREGVMRLVVQYLPKALANPSDIDARTQLSWASTLSMSVLHRLGGGAGQLTLHGIEHALSGYYDLTHGEGLAALLPAWMRFTLKDRKDRFAKLGRTVFGKADGILATEEWLESVGVRLRLRDLGCKLEDAAEVGRLTMQMSPWVATHPTPIDAAAVEAMFKEGF